jgi:hypothetical protein
MMEATETKWHKFSDCYPPFKTGDAENVYISEQFILKNKNIYLGGDVPDTSIAVFFLKLDDKDTPWVEVTYVGWYGESGEVKFVGREAIKKGLENYRWCKIPN